MPSLWEFGPQSTGHCLADPSSLTPSSLEALRPPKLGYGRRVGGSGLRGLRGQGIGV